MLAMLAVRKEDIRGYESSDSPFQNTFMSIIFVVCCIVDVKRNGVS